MKISRKKIQDSRVETGQESIVVTAAPKKIGREGATPSGLGARARSAFRFPQFVDNLRVLLLLLLLLQPSISLQLLVGHFRPELLSRILDMGTLHRLKIPHHKDVLPVPLGSPRLDRLDRSGPATRGLKLFISRLHPQCPEDLFEVAFVPKFGGSSL